MTSKKENTAKREAKTDLLANYRPLALKAVLAAHLMLKKSKPSTTAA